MSTIFTEECFALELAHLTVVSRRPSPRAVKQLLFGACPKLFSPTIWPRFRSDSAAAITSAAPAVPYQSARPRDLKISSLLDPPGTFSKPAFRPIV